MSGPPPLLILTNEILRELMSLDDHLHAAETAFRLLGEGKAELPRPLHIPGAGGDFHVKSAMLALGRPYVAVKTNANFPSNPSSNGLPTIQGAILLFDGTSGSALALLDSIEITSARTGAASALAARFLATPEARTITICGCGEQGRIQLASLANVLRLERVFAWDRDLDRARTFASTWSEELGIEVSQVAELERATLESDVIVTCTTSREAFLAPGAVRPGTFIAAVGADNPAKQEISTGLIAGATVYADVVDQALSMGDTHHAVAAGVVQPQHLAGGLADLVTGRAPGRTSDSEITIFDSTGTAVQDVAASAMAYERAVKRGAGQTVQLG